MLEVLLNQYLDQFGEEFPLYLFKGQAEIDVINTVYDCLFSNEAYYDGRETTRRIGDAPGQKK